MAVRIWSFGQGAYYSLWAGVLSILLAQPMVSAAEYTNAINDGQWRARSSVFECSIEQKVPYFGKVVFETKAGHNSCVFLQSQPYRFKAGKARLVAQSPVWMPDEAPFDFGKISLKKGNRPFWKGSDYAELMMAQLHDGKELTFTKDHWFEAPQSAPSELRLTSIGFREEYRKYLNCLGGLLPASFDQVKRTALYFPPGNPEELSNKMLAQIDKMLLLVKHDPKIRQFYVDGHTDIQGDRADNLELSKLRAEMVSQYLMARGVPEDWVTVRWHGERYPVSRSNHAKNRRVTVRMEKVEALEVLPLASAN